MDEVDENGWDVIEDLEDEDDIFDALVQVGGDFPPEYREGGPVVTPRLRSNLKPGEYELYRRDLERKLRFYAWSRVDALGTGLVDPESLVQEALIERHMDPRNLPAEDVERFAVQSIRWAASKLYRSAERRDPVDFGELDFEGAEFVPQKLSDGSWEWIKYYLSGKTAEAVRLVLEEQYTHQEAATKVGLRRLAVTRGFAKLREEARGSDQGKDT